MKKKSIGYFGKSVELINIQPDFKNDPYEEV
jgi:hypothetical protein